MKKNPPCLNCPKKGCGSYHDKCDIFQDYKQALQEESEKRRLSKLSRDYISEGAFVSRGRVLSGRKERGRRK